MPSTHPDETAVMKNLGQQPFVAKYGSVYEHSAWVAEGVFQHAVDDGLDTTKLSQEKLTRRFESVFMTAPRDWQMATLKAHPQLACALDERDRLTVDSVVEQSGAGLDMCSPTEYAEFARLNKSYIETFGFPFIIAVKGLDLEQILVSFRVRLQNDAEQEFITALEQVQRIAGFRIEGLQNDR